MNNQTRIYQTNFPLTENQISEKGIWINGGIVGLDWGDVVTTPGLAMGKDGPAKYSDPTALLAGAWGPNQTVQATVFSRNQTEKYCQEVEIRLRSSLTNHYCAGYEILFRCLKNQHAYMEVVRWNGPLADFTYLSRNQGAQFGVSNGDVVKAAIIGDEISVFINNALMVMVKDNAFVNGNPGLGFNYGCEDTYGDFGFTSFMAADGTE